LLRPYSFGCVVECPKGSLRFPSDGKIGGG
jgi:hypothetical protein